MADVAIRKRVKIPAVLKKYLKDHNFDSYDGKLIADNLMMKSRNELLELSLNKDIPIVISGTATALLKDLIKGKFGTLQYLFERSFGQAPQLIEMRAVKTKYDDMTEEQKDAKFNELIEKWQQEKEKDVTPEK